MNPTEKYINDAHDQVQKNVTDIPLLRVTCQFTREAIRAQHMKTFTWMGIPILQFPGDLMVVQDLLFKISPDFIIECGIAFGGFTKFCATMMDVINMECEIFAIDIEIRKHAQEVLSKITFPEIHQLQMSSTDPGTIRIIKKKTKPFYKAYRECPAIYDPPAVIVFLDSNHTHEHVLQELRLYAPLVSVGSYIVVFDTAIEFFSDVIEQDRPWGKGNNPWTAVQAFLKENDNFVIDPIPETMALVTSAPGGFLRRVK